VNLSAAHVAELCGEIDPLVRGATIREVQGLPPRDVLIVLETGGKPAILRLRCSADPDAPRLHLQRARVDRHDGPLGPFFRRLEKELAGGTVAGVAPVRSDRIAILEVRDAPSGERRALLLELFGRRANLVLVGPGDRILDVLVPPPEARRRRASPRGMPGVPRPVVRASPGRRWRRSSAPAASSRATRRSPRSSRTRSGARPARRGARARRAISPSAWSAASARPAVSCAGSRRGARPWTRSTSCGGTARCSRRTSRRCGAGLDSIELADPFDPDGPPRRIELDPGLSPRANLERLFARAKKLERSRASVESELGIAGRKAARLAELVELVRDGADEPAAIEARAIEEGLLEPRQAAPPKKRPEPGPRLPYRAFEGARGSEIRVGRTARDNDDLTFRHAKGSDLWLHTADTPGSHVVLVLSKGADPDSEELIDAAHLAVHYSPLRDSGRARVHVARRKEVHKPRGAKPGLVQLSGGRILDVRMQPDRLRRLLGTREPPAGETGAG
jgi:predicted ribosome quality control (RQC) complex YloA/Tae2 family protein